MIFTALCPLTYRGYNYDFTTGLYYLQSRYYNPEWGRFLNCDDTAILLATQGETHNANLFAYCANNPVNRVDYKGKYSTDLTTSVNTELIQGMTFFILVYNNPIRIWVDAKAHKGGISIDLTKKSPYMNGEFSEVLFSMYEVYKEQYGKKTAKNIFYILAVFATYMFYEDFPSEYFKKVTDNTYKNQIKKREFLFKDECVADEIRAHCEGYWDSIGKIEPTIYSNILHIGANVLERDFQKACVSIDIAEQDVYNDADANVFGYYSGIRKAYTYTKADPYFYSTYNNGGRRMRSPRESWRYSPIIPVFKN